MIRPTLFEATQLQFFSIFVNTIFFIDLVGKQVLKAVKSMTFNRAKHMVQQNMINFFANWMNLLFNLIVW